LDLSLVGTGLATVIYGEVGLVHGWTNVKATQKKYPDLLSFYKCKDAQDYAHRMHRIEVVSNWIMKVLMHLSARGHQIQVAIEGYSLASKGSRVSDQHELGGVVKRLLWEIGVPFRVYPPSTIKKAWTGSGSSGKPAMAIACFKRFKLDFAALGEAGENLVDAVCIAQLLYQELRLHEGADVASNIAAALDKPLGKGGSCISNQPFIQKEGFEKRFATPIYGNYLEKCGGYDGD
jgi:Holliday junction resolvasome RuvABC endonuclease subunit